MKKLSPEQLANARKIESVILRHLAQRSARQVAEELGIHESTVSRWKEEKLPMVSNVLAALDLQVVSCDTMTIEHDEKLSLMRLAKQYLDTQLAHEEMEQKKSPMREHGDS